MSKAYFFPHNRVPGHGRATEVSEEGTYPGRVPFDVRARLVTLAGDGVVEIAVVAADGYRRNEFGPNQDPCVFTRPVHSFCRIGTDNPSSYVWPSCEKLLPDVVEAGDAIFYGNIDPVGQPNRSRRLWVDTVLVVERVERWPTSPRANQAPCPSGVCKELGRVRSPPEEFARAVWGEGESGNVLDLNLQDGGPNGTHCCTNLCEAGVILGTVTAAPGAGQTLQTSFVTLATRDKGNDWWPSYVTREDLPLFVWNVLEAHIDGAKGSILELPGWDLAKRLARAIVEMSGRPLKDGGRIGEEGRVAIPPLTPVEPMTRWDPRTQESKPFLFPPVR